MLKTTYLALLALFFSAVTIAHQDAAAPKRIPAAEQAYRDAFSNKDPAKQIESLEKLIVDYPDSSSAWAAKQSIIRILIEKFPDRQEEISKRTAEVLAKLPEEAKRDTLRSLANAMTTAGILLDKAEEMAKQALALMDERKSVESSKKSYADRKEKPPDDAYLVYEFRLTWAQALKNLGRTLVKRSKDSEAESAFLGAYRYIPEEVAEDLSDLALKKGNRPAALEYLMVASSCQGLGRDHRNTLESLYREAHNATLEGLETMLDERAKAYPSPLDLKPYVRSANRSKRVVLAELFTTTGCGPCISADVMFEAILTKYTKEDVAVLVYHGLEPGPDPMFNQASESRERYYVAKQSIGYPSYVVDGKFDSGGGFSRAYAPRIYNHYGPQIEKRLEATEQARIELNAVRNENVVRVHASVSGYDGAGTSKLHIALVEKNVHFAGTNGVRFHPMVVRWLAGPSFAGLDLSSSGASALDYEFDLSKIAAETGAFLDELERKGLNGRPVQFKGNKPVMNSDNMAVVAWVQDVDNKQVLQSRYVECTLVRTIREQEFAMPVKVGK